jgi:hypothetical protein
MSVVWRPMPLVPIPGAFDHPDWLFELKHDGFRALAHVDGHQCTLRCRRGHVYKQFPMLSEEIAHAVRVESCVLDGEIVCLAPDGRSLFHQLLFRRDWPHFMAFDVLAIDGEDVRERPLLERKRRLRAIMPQIESRLVYISRRGPWRRPVRRGVCQRPGRDRREVETRPLLQRRWPDILAEGQKSTLLTDGWPTRVVRRSQSGQSLEAGEACAV